MQPVTLDSNAKDTWYLFGDNPLTDLVEQYDRSSYYTQVIRRACVCYGVRARVLSIHLPPLCIYICACPPRIRRWSRHSCSV